MDIRNAKSTILKKRIRAVLSQNIILLLPHFLLWEWVWPCHPEEQVLPSCGLVPAPPPLPPPSPPFPSWPCHLRSNFFSAFTFSSPRPTHSPPVPCPGIPEVLFTSVLSLNGCVQDLPYWQGRLGVHRVPSLVFLRGPGALPAVYDASNTRRLDIAKLVADNSWQVLSSI